jgi:hypothetical protein
MMRGYNSAPEDHLFHKGDWFATAQAQKQKLVQEIEGQNGNELLNTSTTDLAQHYASKFTIDVPVIYPDDLVVDQRETQVDVSHQRDRYFSDRSGPHYVAGTSVDVDVPFTGDGNAFHIQPTTQNFNNPRARIGNGHLHFSIAGTGLTADRVKADIDSRISAINQHLTWLRNDVQGYNASLLALATQTIESRKEKLLKDQSLVAGLGFKMKTRSNSNDTYAAPTVRRVIRPEVPKPASSRQPFKPEPTLLTADYEHILSVLENMVKVMEQSPGAFQKIDEESLRTHFLVQLNGHYAGGATGETFNFEGKTDILIKVDGKNIFIGECKFWTGEQGYLETLDQVLSYLSWRDTKAAVLVFSRKKDFSAVLQKIAEFTPKHANFKKIVSQRSETSWSYLFGHKDDANREILITVQGYNVPDRIEPRIRTV